MLNLLQNSKSPPHRTPRTLGPGPPRSCSVMRAFPMPSQHGLRGSGAHGSPLFHLKPWRNQRRPQQTEAKARRAPWDTRPLKRPTRVPKPKMRTVLPPAPFLLQDGRFVGLASWPAPRTVGLSRAWAGAVGKVHRGSSPSASHTASCQAPGMAVRARDTSHSCLSPTEATVSAPLGRCLLSLLRNGLRFH